ncbi:hypothetical protein AOXY_G21544 [Acipenser oxyrinchus oxyrinchus]|uniref:Uncharacterized protein n=1 Tax=Acipenser oxyrinchus oxyrinchus TaxID=40147 RepID=A0AAD8D2S3_ACIOX|nr:hypothetical protein AOXY_G21544 [Acipenser oxyrinchus oxyrinchus]
MIMIQALCYCLVLLSLRFAGGLPFHANRGRQISALSHTKEEAALDGARRFLDRGGIGARHGGRGSFMDRPGKGGLIRVPTEDSIKRHQQPRCVHMTEPWTVGRPSAASLPGDRLVYRLKVHASSAAGQRQPIFPQQQLFQYLGKVYQCCKTGFVCRKIKGIQGRLTRDADRGDVEFLVNPDVGALAIQRAELHVQISNPDRLRVEPVLTLQHAENQDAVSSRYVGVMREGVSDLTFLFQTLKDLLGRGSSPQTPEPRREGVPAGAAQPGRAGLLSVMQLWGEGVSLEGAQTYPLRRSGSPGVSLRKMRGRGPFPAQGSSPEGPVPAQGSSPEAPTPAQALTELSLTLNCVLEETLVSCAEYGVTILPAPFITIAY